MESNKADMETKKRKKEKDAIFIFRCMMFCTLYTIAVGELHNHKILSRNAAHLMIILSGVTAFILFLVLIWVRFKLLKFNEDIKENKK